MRKSVIALAFFLCSYVALGQICENCNGECCPNSRFYFARSRSTCCLPSEKCVGNGVCEPRKMAAFWLPLLWGLKGGWFIGTVLKRLVKKKKYEPVSDQSRILVDERILNRRKKFSLLNEEILREIQQRMY